MHAGDRPNEVRKALAIVGLIVCICASIGAAMVAGWEHSLAAEVAAANRDPNAPISDQLMTLILCQVGVGLVSVIASLFTAVVFLMWHYRAATNARALGAELLISPGWAVGWWFIPVASLVMPVRSILEISKASIPPDDDLIDLGHPGPGSSSSLIGAWWGSWIISNIAGWFSATSSGNATTPDAARTSAIIGLSSEVLNVCAGALAIMVILSITGRQLRCVAAKRSAPSPPEEYAAF